MDKNKKVQIIVLAGLVLTVIALFLTLYKASFLGQNVSDSIFNAYSKQGKTGYIVLFLASPILASVFVLLKKRIPVIIFGLLQCGLWALLTSTFKDQFKGIKVTFSYGAGFYVGLLGAVIILLGGIIAIATGAFKEPK
ncbi:hypothetical protein HMPREF0378_0223 [Eubacterium nodatum ATCC 33099]|nr:hypothetical protein HMPREF0378_0223 [Eubacterium nodatum ATCC 33099]